MTPRAPAAKALAEVLSEVRLHSEISPDLKRRMIAGLEYDSRRVEKDFLFFAFAGSRMDGRRFAADAISRGALAIVSDQPQPPDSAGTWIAVEHARQALSRAALNFYDHPDRRLSFTGITGTNGKTTTSFLTDAILRSAGHVTGLIGTIEYRLADETQTAVNTTPESLDFLRFASRLIARGGKYLTAEISSHALAQGRVHGFEFHTAVFTNLTRDHLDFHRTMEEYAAAKRRLFASPHVAVLNADDPASASMVPPNGSRVIWYGISNSARLRAENISSGFDGLRFDLVYEGARHPIESALVGRINVLNILAAAGVGLSYGLTLEEIARGVASLKSVPGRFERVDCGQPFLVVVDYAHTDDALRNAIQVARGLASERVITLFGCGGDRDRSKRPLMGMAAAELSDFVVLTSDNPRSEDPLGIMNDAMVGIRRFDAPHIAEPDRARAIRRALTEAKPGDVVLIAGKGHEPYQILPTGTIHFDDRETARSILQSLGYTRTEGGGGTE